MIKYSIRRKPVATEAIRDYKNKFLNSKRLKILYRSRARRSSKPKSQCKDQQVEVTIPLGSITLRAEMSSKIHVRFN